MNKLSIKKRVQVLACLLEGASISDVASMTGAARNTVTKLLADVGSACSAHADRALRHLPCRRLQCDPIWSGVYSVPENVSNEKTAPQNEAAWTWTAIDEDTKLVPCWMIGPRNGGIAYEFMTELAGRLANGVRLTTDRHKAYLDTVDGSVGVDIDYAMLVVLYGEALGQAQHGEHSRNVWQGTPPAIGIDELDMPHVSTSRVERQNLLMRMGMHRFPRLTNDFSKKLENLGRAVALHFMYYNFGRIHQSLRITPAMAADITEHVWSLEEIAALPG